MLLLTCFGLSTLHLITRLGHMILMNLYEKSKTLVMATAICGIKKDSLPFTKVLGFVVCRVTSNFLGIGASERSWGDVKTIKSGKDLPLAVMYQKNRVLFIHPPVLNQLELNNTNQTNNFMTILQAIH